MRRFRDERPADVCFARGTFNSHPYVMGAMHEFLQRLEARRAAGAVPGSGRDLEHARGELNARLQAEDLNVRVANLSTIWTVCYPRPSRYNWMLQYYLRAHGLALSWVGTGTLIFSLDYTDADFAAVADSMLSAARAMQQDGWWWAERGAVQQGHQASCCWEMLRARLRQSHRVDQLAPQ